MYKKVLLKCYKRKRKKNKIKRKRKIIILVNFEPIR